MRVFLETERLILRQFTMDDLDDLCALNSDPEVMRYTTGGLPVPRETIEHDFLPYYLAYYERSEGYGFWAVIEKASGEFLGWFHFRPHGDDPPDQPELGVRRVVASAYGENVASRRVMEKVGMTLVRTFRFPPEEMDEVPGIDPAMFDGDDVEYAITKAEWEARRSRGR